MAGFENPGDADFLKGENLHPGFIAALNILRKNIRTYPPGHNAIVGAGEMLTARLQDMFSDSPTFTINAIRNNLLINGVLIDKKNSHASDLAMFISQLGAASLTLKKGLSGEELNRFLELALSVPPKNYLYQHRDILDKINALPHIRTREIDLSAVRFTDEDASDSSPAGAPITTWQKLMLGCLSPGLLEVQDAALLKTIRVYDQGSLNNFLQAFEIPAERLTASYSNVLRSQFSSASEQESELQDKHDFFKQLHRAFHEVTPGLKEQILEVTFDTINTSPDEESLEELLNCMSGDMVVEVLTQAVLNKKIVSPMLIKLLSVLYRAGRQVPEDREQQGSPGNPVWDRIEELFSREGYEKYLPADYAEQLQSISLGSGGNSSGSPAGFSIPEHSRALQDRNVNRHLVLALLSLMDGEIEEQIYCDYAGQISRLIPELLEAGDYRLLSGTFKALRKQLERSGKPAARAAAAGVLGVFSGSAFMSGLEEAYRLQEGGSCRELEELILATGPKNLPWLIDHYLRQKNTGQVLQAQGLIRRFGPQVAEIALEKMAEEDSEQTIALLKLIGDLSDSASSARINRLLKSKNSAVRLEAIKTLLKNRDPAATAALREAIGSRDNEIALEAMKIVKDFKVKALVPELALQIKTFYISGAGMKRNKAVLALLGSLGSKEALPVLEKKAGAKFSLTPGNLRQTREYFYTTLAGYPRASIGQLVNRGLNSGNAKIAGTCKKLGSLQADEAAGNSDSPG